MHILAEEFFESFTSKFDLTKNLEIVNTYFYKYRHTYDVEKYMSLIINDLDDHEKEVALTTAMFHDLGRFTQLEKYGRYSDYLTKFSHAKESVNILLNNNWFEKNNINDSDKDSIIFAILNHSNKKIDNCEGFTLVLSKLIRDADKLAIIKRSPFELEEYQNDLGSVTKEAMNDFVNFNLVDFENVKTPLDRIIATMSYIFDLNYSISKELLIKDNLLEDYLINLKEKMNIEDYSLIEKTINQFLK